MIYCIKPHDGDGKMRKVEVGEENEFVMIPLEQ